MFATNERVDQARSITSTESMRDGETVRLYFERTSEFPLTAHENETVEALERIQRIWDKAKANPTDSTAIIRRGRDANHRNRLLG